MQNKKYKLVDGRIHELESEQAKTDAQIAKMISQVDAQQHHIERAVSKAREEMVTSFWAKLHRIQELVEKMTGEPKDNMIHLAQAKMLQPEEPPSIEKETVELTKTVEELLGTNVFFFILVLFFDKLYVFHHS